MKNNILNEILESLKKLEEQLSFHRENVDRILNDNSPYTLKTTFVSPITGTATYSPSITWTTTPVLTDGQNDTTINKTVCNDRESLKNLKYGK